LTDQTADEPEATERDAELAALTEEITRLIHDGESVDLDDYAKRHPRLAGPARRLLPTLLGLAELSRSLSGTSTPDERQSPSR
jgi:hypothetical protein